MHHTYMCAYVYDLYVLSWQMIIMSVVHMLSQKGDITVLDRIVIAVMKYPDQNQPEKARVYLGYISKLQFIIKDNQHSNSTSRLEGLPHMVPSANFLIEPRATNTDMAPCTMG